MESGYKRHRGAAYGQARVRAAAYRFRGMHRAAAYTVAPYQARKIQRGQRGYLRTAGYYRQTAAKASVELKFHDVDLDDAVVATGGTITDSINKIAQGVTESERIGRKCNIRSIQWRMNVSLPTLDAQALAQVEDTVRTILYQDTQCNGATAAVTDILEAANWQSFNNLANKGRFKILMDKEVDLNPLAIASDGDGLMTTAGVTRTHTFFKKCNIPVEFSATTGAITEIRSNNLGVLQISQSGKGSFESKIRLRFVG